MRVLLLAAFVALVSAKKGFDGIQAISKATFECLKKDGYDFVITRVWTSNGNYDTTGIQNVKNARAAGWTDVGAYIFPCLESKCAHAANQVEATIDRLKADGAEINYLWLDIERLAWPASHATNRQFIEDMVNQAKKQNVKVGIYSNNNNWEAIVGLDWKPYPSLPLWWANYNNEEGFGKYVEFGGWKEPTIHQYKGTTAGPCSVSMDLNYKA